MKPKSIKESEERKELIKFLRMYKGHPYWKQAEGNVQIRLTLAKQVIDERSNKPEFLFQTDCLGILDSKGTSAWVTKVSEALSSEMSIAYWYPSLISTDEKYIKVSQWGNLGRVGESGVIARLYFFLDFDTSLGFHPDFLLGKLGLHPCYKTETSLGRFQYLFEIDSTQSGVAYSDQWDNINERLARILGADSAVIGGAHLLRLPGSFNRKAEVLGGDKWLVKGESFRKQRSIEGEPSTVLGLSAFEDRKKEIVEIYTIEQVEDRITGFRKTDLYKELLDARSVVSEVIGGKATEYKKALRIGDRTGDYPSLSVDRDKFTVGKARGSVIGVDEAFKLIKSVPPVTAFVRSGERDSTCISWVGELVWKYLSGIRTFAECHDDLETLMKLGLSEPLSERAARDKHIALEKYINKSMSEFETDAQSLLTGFDEALESGDLNEFEESEVMKKIKVIENSGDRDGDGENGDSSDRLDIEEMSEEAQRETFYKIFFRAESDRDKKVLIKWLVSYLVMYHRLLNNPKYNCGEELLGLVEKRANKLGLAKNGKFYIIISGNSCNRKLSQFLSPFYCVHPQRFARKFMLQVYGKLKEFRTDIKENSEVQGILEWIEENSAPKDRASGKSKFLTGRLSSNALAHFATAFKEATTDDDFSLVEGVSSVQGLTKSVAIHYQNAVLNTSSRRLETKESAWLNSINSVGCRFDSRVAKIVGAQIAGDYSIENVQSVFYSAVMKHCPKFYKYCAVSFGDEGDDKGEGVTVKEAIRVLLAMIGYSMIPSNPFASFFYIYGVGGSGKSVLARVIQGLLDGNNCGLINYDRVTAPNGGLLHAENKLVCVIPEIPNPVDEGARDKENRARLVNGILLPASGGDKITVKAMYRAERSVYLGCKFLLTSNYELGVKDAKGALKRRMRSVYFGKSVGNTAEERVNLDSEILEGEGDTLGTLAGMMVSYLWGYRERMFEFRESALQLEAKSEFMEMLDPFQALLKDVLIIEKGRFIPTKVLVALISLLQDEHPGAAEFRGRDLAESQMFWRKISSALNSWPTKQSRQLKRGPWRLSRGYSGITLNMNVLGDRFQITGKDLSEELVRLFGQRVIIEMRGENV